MEIKRYGESRDKGTTTLVDKTSIPTLRFNSNQNLEVIFKDVPSPDQRNTSYRYTVTFTPDDLGKILAEAMKQALTKSK